MLALIRSGIAVLLVAAAFHATADPGARIPGKAVFIILDGIPADVIERVETPVLDEIARAGGYARSHVGGEPGGPSETPTISAPGYMSLITGTWGYKHNVWDNSRQTPNYRYWNLFRIVETVAPGRKTAIFSTWLDNRTVLVGEGRPGAGEFRIDHAADGFENDTIAFPQDPDSLYIRAIDDRVANEAAAYIAAEGPDLSWVYLQYTDNVAHAYGDGAAFDAAVQSADERVGRIWDSVKRRQAMGEDWMVMVTTDHGRDPATGRDHGGQTARERTTWIVTNQTRLDSRFTSGASAIVDIAPSILQHLGIAPPAEVAAAMDGVSFLAAAPAGQRESYDYWRFDRDLVRRGQQALFMCNGLFTSNRSLEQVFAQELAYLPDPIGTPEGGDYQVDRARRAVTVGAGGYVPAMRAAFREGLGCVVLAPDQDLEDASGLPELTLPPPPGDPSELPWPDGDAVPEKTLEPAVRKALQAASDWAFDRESAEQVTTALLVLHGGEIVHERYAPGFDVATRTRTWSTAKSIAATLIGMLVDAGKLDLDAPLAVDWLPATATGTDPRTAVSLRHLLHMSSGLEPVDNDELEYATGSGLAYWAGASSARGARSRGLIRTPGTNWDYENYDTLLAVYAMKQALGDAETYLEFPRRALLDRIGMRNTLVGVDRFGDFILSSQIHTNARDLARFGLLYLNGGVWNGERLLSEEWIAFVRQPAPATEKRGREYGAHWWLVPDDRLDVPRDAYTTAGNRGQYVIVVPSHELVIVRRGLDWGRQGFDCWDLTREVLKAFGRDP